MNLVAMLGFLAGTLNLLAVLPQILRIIHTRHTKDISFPTYILLNLATLMWIIYGILINQAPVFVINGIYLVLNLTVLVLKIRYS